MLLQFLLMMVWIWMKWMYEKGMNVRKDMALLPQLLALLCFTSKNKIMWKSERRKLFNSF